MRLAAGLGPDPLDELQRSPDRLDVIRGEERKGRERKGLKNRGGRKGRE